MPAEFDREGVHFSYPENWGVEEAALDEGWSVALQSPPPGTAFMTISVHNHRPPVQDVLETALSALREDYPELEAEAASERIAKHLARGYDIQFFSMDLVNSCWIRSFRTAHQTVLILCQSSDLEADYAEPVLRAIQASLRVEEA